MFSLALYENPVLSTAAHPWPSRAGPDDPMESTMFRNIANPRRTTLAHLDAADRPQAPEQPEHPVVLPTQTANPRRTILMDAPAAS